MIKYMRFFKRLILGFFVFYILAGLPVGPIVFGQETTDDFSDTIYYKKAIRTLGQLSPEERVGQLFLVTFDETNTDTQSEVFDLVTNYFVGGLVLKGSNNNFVNTETAREELCTLIDRLQEIEWDSKGEVIRSEETTYTNNYIPLFIGLDHSGGGYPFDDLFNGIIQSPTLMAIGATWNIDAAISMGSILGGELSNLGFNLVFSPSLDVLDVSNIEKQDSLGVRTFGGDPYWVGKFGIAYIRGLHEGSRGKLTVISKNFPGRGSSDRLPGAEVATIRKSLAQLELIELAPFFAATDTSQTDSQSITDGLLQSHIRYQGLQGNIRATSKPISFDATAVELLMALPDLNEWRKNGGLLVSDDLGSPAVDKFFNPSGQYLDARQIVRNAFLASNDILYIDQLLSTNDGSRFDTYRNTINLFVQKYREDQAFAERVDDSVLRILAQKYKQYDEFLIENVLARGTEVNPTDLDQILFEIASQSATLISPTQNQLNEEIPSEPQLNEQIVIFTDSLSAIQCDACAPQEIIAADDLQKAIERLYGPQGGGQISLNQITSYSFLELRDYVSNPFNRPEIETNLSRADWVLFLMHDLDSDRPESYALHQLVSQNPGVLRDKKVIVFSMGAPYYFDATEISYFTAYYCLYSKIPVFINVAARILFQEINPIGASPVSIPAIAYDLITETTPDPDQIIELAVDYESTEIVDQSATNNLAGSEEEPAVIFRLGDNLPVKTGIIVDHNNHPVPDGTVVRFIMTQQEETITSQQVEAITIEGIAKAAVKLQQPGFHEVRVVSEPAANSQILTIEISETEQAIVSSIIPTSMPTINVEEALEGNAQSFPPVSAEPEEGNNRLIEWIMATIFVWMVGAGFYFGLKHRYPMVDRLVISCASVLSGLIITLFLIFDFSGNSLRIGLSGFITLLFSVLIGNFLGGFIGWIYIQSKV